jgi:hypothetical protein
VSFARTQGRTSDLTDDDKRLVVANYFLNEDSFGKIHFEGDHYVHVVKCSKPSAVDRRLMNYYRLCDWSLASPWDGREVERSNFKSW